MLFHQLINLLLSFILLYLRVFNLFKVITPHYFNHSLSLLTIFIQYFILQPGFSLNFISSPKFIILFQIKPFFIVFFIIQSCQNFQMVHFISLFSWKIELYQGLVSQKLHHFFGIQYIYQYLFSYFYPSLCFSVPFKLPIPLHPAYASFIEPKLT